MEILFNKLIRFAISHKPKFPAFSPSLLINWASPSESNSVVLFLTVEMC